MKISVIIPTYKEPEYLDLCIQSSLEGQVNQNEIIPIVDGFGKVNEPTLQKYGNNIRPLIFNENHGQTVATNQGVYNASNDVILVVNDDNVFPKDWDFHLMSDFIKHADVMTPNQIEPYDSMFKQFRKHDFGKTVKTFDKEMWYQQEPRMRQTLVDNSGSTLPFMMSKENFLKVGGWDERYPSGNVVDWDFFLKCNLCGLNLKRTYKCNFYHFVSIGTRSPEQVEETKKNEAAGFEYFKYKWGKYPKHDPINNLKSLQ